MELLDVGLDDARLVEALATLRTAASSVDAPWLHPMTPQDLHGFIEYGWDLEPGRHLAVLDGGEVVAHAVVHTSDWDNHDLAWLELHVHPQHRGRGLGTAAFEALRAQAEGLGRTKLGVDAWDGTAGERFALAQGFERRSQAINRRQHLAEVARERLAELYDEALEKAAGYELVRIVGRTPEDLLPEVSRMTESINDAPLDALDIEDEVFPPQRIRDYETATLGRGNRLYRLLARNRDTGELAGHTIVAVDVAAPERGHQHDTTVVPSHRGHRLGLLLKSGMNLWLADEEPQLETIDTWNAESNDFMIRVNEAVGYRWMGRQLDFQ